jgi:chromosome segregation ATPase
LTKYEILVKDLETIETQVSILKHNYQDISKRNKELEQIVSKSEKEKLALQQKISDLQNELKKFHSAVQDEGDLLNSLNLKERESLKVKLQDLIARINYHLSIDRQT